MAGGSTRVLLAAVCFGVTIPLSKWVLDDAAPLPYTLVALRFGLGGAVALPFALRRADIRRDRARRELRAAIACAVPLLAGYVLLTVGLQHTTSTVSAFLSYLLVVIVPLLSAAVYRRLPESPVALAAGIVLSVAGLRLLTGGAGGVGLGEGLSLGAAVVFAVHVMAIGHFAADVDALRFTAFQCVAVAAGALPLAIAFDGLALPAVAIAGGLAIAVANVAGLVLQTIGQREVSPARAGLLLMVDPVVAAAGGYVLGDRIGLGGVAGAALILSGIAVAETLGARHARVADRS